MSGDQDMEDHPYINDVILRELPPVPMTERNGPKELSKIESCFRRNWSIASKVSLLGIIALLLILLIIVCAYSISVHIEEGEERNTRKHHNESESNGKVFDKLKYSTPEPEKHLCPVTWNKIGGSCYSFSLLTENWQDAYSKCVEQNSKLLILTSKEEMESLLPWMKEKAYWIGLRKFSSRMIWFDGTPLTYSNWSKNEPNNLGGTELCVEMRPQGWNDLHCEINLHYICKK
ncbi:CD209 antigen-like protein C [Leptodactylus fuscus]|uniref:CD209 antigen-like protein C n=1 Tax=Leptodactylus fuscus TaxID=238119 RepID=UPI003F4F159A